jgi:site-specific recombinase XerD
MSICKYKINFILEKRKEKGILLTENIPILMSVTWNSKRLWYYSGYRIDSNKWIDKTPDGEKVQRVRKNSFNRDNISASVINARITELENNVNDIVIELGKEIPTIEKLREKIRTKLEENTKEPKELSLFDYFGQYIKEAKVTLGRKKQLTSTLNHFKKFSDSRHQKITFERCNVSLLTEFETYLKKSHSEEDKPRSRNTITGIFSRLRTFFLYAVNQEWTKINPFENYSIEPEIYGDPIYLTKEERDKLFYAEIKNDRLDRVRDMFVLQCFIGCRVGDFVKLKKSNIVNGFIHYVPSKTQDENQKVCKIPLSEKALTIINKYDLPDGSLVPYITGQKYNEYLKELFALNSVGLTRPVVRLNPLTRLNETIPLNEIACSHMARRTFIGLLHKTVKNEVIASMSGHIENSKAFHRYYNVDEESQKDAIKTIE